MEKKVLRFGKNDFVYSPGADNGLVLQGDVRSMKIVNKLLLAASNDDSLRVFKLR